MHIIFYIVIGTYHRNWLYYYYIFPQKIEVSIVNSDLIWTENVHVKTLNRFVK